MLGIDMSEHGVEVGRLRPRGVIEHSIEALRDAAESQPHQLLGDVGVEHRAHHSHTLMIQGQSYQAGAQGGIARHRTTTVTACGRQRLALS